MKIRLLCIGAVKDPTVSECIARYAKRIPFYWPFEIENLPDVKTGKGIDAQKQKELEGDRMLAEIGNGDFLLLLWEDRGAVPYDITAHPFTDLSGRDAEAQAAAWAWANGLANGVGEDLFAPDRLLTREECAAFLRRYDAFLGRDIFLPLGPSLCNDYEGISPWAQDDLYWACITGRMDWLENRLAPLSPVTWEEAEGYFTALPH